MDKPKRRHIVIVGGGFGGLAAAGELRKADADVTIINKTNHHLFQPLLYQVATAALSPGDIAAPLRALIGKYKNIKVILAEVEVVKPDSKELILMNGRKITFDQLILAPGSNYNYFGNKSWEKHAAGLKSIGDALRIRERILFSLEEAEQIEDPKLREPYLTFSIIGGGPTGVEMAGAIAEIAKRNLLRDYKRISSNEVRIFLIEAASRILSSYPESLSEKARIMLENMGVRVLLDTPVTGIEKNCVSFSKDNIIKTPNIIWAAGVVASPLLKFLNAEQDDLGRVKVNADLSLPQNPDIFVIGDNAHFVDKQGDPLPALAPVAKQQGEFVGKLLNSNRSGHQQSMTFHYVDKGMLATIGRAKAVANIHGFKLSGYVAWFLWSFIHILFLIGFRNRLRVFAEWVWYYFTFKRGVRLITDR